MGMGTGRRQERPRARCRHEKCRKKNGATTPRTGQQNKSHPQIKSSDGAVKTALGRRIAGERGTGAVKEAIKAKKMFEMSGATRVTEEHRAEGIEGQNAADKGQAKAK